MVTKNLLKYYLDCLKYESYYSSQINQMDLKHSCIDPLQIDHILDRHENLSKQLDNDSTIMFGYPLLKLTKKGKDAYLPLILWTNSNFISDHNFFKADQFGFHQEVYKSLADKHTIDKISELKEKFSLNPRSFLQDTALIGQLLDCTGHEERNIDRCYVIIHAKSKDNSNYHIVEEIQAILEGKIEPSPVLKSFLTHSYAIPNTENPQFPLHIVPGNSPQNEVLHDIDHTISIVKGPPGTGKTQTILNLIANQVGRQQTCIVASTNNQAVDNIIEKLDGNGINKIFYGYVRLGSIQNNKNIALKIQKAIERMKEESTNKNNDTSYETYLSYVDKSRTLMDQITKSEQYEQQIVDMTNAIDQLQSLIGILNDRLRLHHLTNMKSNFEILAIANEQIEFRLRELVDQPTQLYGNDIFRKFRAFIAGKIHTYFNSRFKRQLRSIGAPQLWEHIDTTTPIQSLAFCEEVVKVINLEKRLIQQREELSLIKIRQQEQSSDLKTLYSDKNEYDLLILRYEWLSKARPILSNYSEMNNITSLVKELQEKGKIKNNSSAFPSFLKLFPVLLVSSLSARNCIPTGVSLELAIIDESSQCSISSVFSLLQSTRRACFLGDSNQLSHIAALEDTLSQTLFETHSPGIALEPYCFRNISAFERAEKACQLNDGGMHLLNYHYRCIPSIASFSNQHFYHNRLRTMRQEPQRQPYATGIYSTNVYSRVSGTVNKQEIEEIKAIVSKLEDNGISQIGIVTPFSAQKMKLIEVFRGKPNIKIGTVHTFQGGECQAIIFSTVISQGSTPFQIEFVQSSYRLINVALTRALDYFILVGNLAQIDNGKGYLTKLSRYIYTIEASSFHRPSIEISIAFNQIIQQGNRKELMHEGERMIYNKLLIYLGSMPLLVFPKVPVKDVLSINMKLDHQLKNYYFTSHLDFVIYEKESLQPLCSIEYDGKDHRWGPKTIKNDELKDNLCKYADFKLIRIKSNDENEGWDALKVYLESLS